MLHRLEQRKQRFNDDVCCFLNYSKAYLVARHTGRVRTRVSRNQVSDTLTLDLLNEVGVTCKLTIAKFLERVYGLGGVSYFLLKGRDRLFSIL